MTNAMTHAPHPVCKARHRQKECHRFLYVMSNIVLLLRQFSNDIDDVRINLIEPAVMGIQLIAKHEPQHFRGLRVDVQYSFHHDP